MKRAALNKESSATAILQDANPASDFFQVNAKSPALSSMQPFFSGSPSSGHVIQRQPAENGLQPDDAGEIIAGVPHSAIVPLSTFDFNDKFQEFGRFDARYTPVGPVPTEGTLDIILWVHINFENFSAKRRKKDPYKNFKFTKDQLKDFNWTEEEKLKFESDFMTSLQSAWSSKFKFHLKEPGFEEYKTKVNITALSVDDPKLAHTKITALKIPKGAPRFRSFVKGNEATLDIRDPSENEDKKVSTHEIVRQIGPFGFDSSALTPQLVDQIKEVSKVIKSDPDPDHWSLGFTGRASSEGEEKYNEKLGGKRADSVQQELYKQLGWGDTATNYMSILSGERNSTKEEKFRRVDIAASKTSSASSKDVKQNTAAHEAGHMFGLGDEYIEEKPTDKDFLPKFQGDNPSHYDAVEKTMGKGAANELLVDSSENIMSSGMTVKKGHYVTFLYALNQITGKTWNVE